MRFRAFPALALFLLAAPALAAGPTPRLVKDINTIPTPVDSAPADFLTVGGTTFFTADDGDTGRELWRTDGTAAGTYRLTDTCPLECSSSPLYFAFSGSSYYFLAQNGDGGRELLGERRHAGHHDAPRRPAGEIRGV